MKSKDRFYPESRFGGFTDIDGTIAFYARVNELLTASSVVVDVGCGRGAYSEDDVSVRKNLRVLKGKVSKVIGLDIDEAAQANPFLDEFHQIDGGRWPIEDDAVDVIVCDNVLEHLEEPGYLFSEIQRILRDGGSLCIRTPNRWSYVGLISALVPNRHHATITGVVQEGRRDEDVFPTFYRCNSIRKLRRTMENHGLECVVYGYEAEPSYLSFSKFAYFLGVVHQKFAPGALKPAIFAFGRLSE